MVCSLYFASEAMDCRNHRFVLQHCLNIFILEAAKLSFRYIDYDITYMSLFTYDHIYIFSPVEYSLAILTKMINRANKEKGVH